MSRRFRALAIMLCLALAVPPVAWGGFSGELDLESGYATNSRDSLDAALGDRSRGDQFLSLRLMWSETFASGWDLDTAYLASARSGPGVELLRAERAASPLFPLDPDRTSLWHLNHVLTDHDRSYAEHRLDRLSLGYRGSRLVVRIGRQALTWGSGLVFHPLDLFDPFPPNATYTTYKTGSDMAYGQWLFDSGADIQAVVVPRRDAGTDKVTADRSSAGAKWHGFLDHAGTVGLDVLFARNYGAQVLGIGLSGPLGGSTWALEAVPERQDAVKRVSVLANAQYAWVWNETNLNGYIEYFHSGFGMSGTDRTLADLPPLLAERIARAELFTLSVNYLAAGISIQVTPLLDLKPSVITNLDDGSSLVIGQAMYGLSQNTSLTAVCQAGMGSRRTEYGGLETAPGSGTYFTPADQASIRFIWYF